MTGDFTVNYAAMGLKIRQKRINLGLTQGVVSEKIGVSESYYGNVERATRIPSIDTIIKIANFLDMSLDYLFMDSRKGDSNDRVMSELDDLFRDLPPAQTEYMLSLLRVVREGIGRLSP